MGAASDRFGAFSVSHPAAIIPLSLCRTCTGLRGTHIIGCDWRLDYHVRSSATGIEHVPVYFVSLKTKGSDGTLGSTDFTCSMEQMQDLLSIVRDATKQLDRILTSQET